MDATVLSFPRTGTHFEVYLLMNILGVTVRFDHFTSSSGPRIQHLLANEPDDHPIIVIEGNMSRLTSEFPIDAVDALVYERGRWMTQLLARSGTVVFNVELKTGVDDLLTALNIARTPAITAFENAWPNISRNTPGPERDWLYANVTDAQRMRISYP